MKLTSIEDLRSKDAKHCIANAWMQCGRGPWPFVPEHSFHATRRWRFDWACLDLLVAIEIDGVVCERKGCSARVGRHQNAKGLEGDCEKLNAAACLGWSVLRFTPGMVARAPVQCVEIVEQLIEARRKMGNSTAL